MNVILPWIGLDEAALANRLKVDDQFWANDLLGWKLRMKNSWLCHNPDGDNAIREYELIHVDEEYGELVLWIGFILTYSKISGMKGLVNFMF